MFVERWIRGPFGLHAERRVTRPGCRVALIPVPSVTAGTRLLDLALLLEDDHRVQVVFSVPDYLDGWNDVEWFIHDHGGLAVPWHQAVQHRFDLVLAASYAGLERISGQVLVVPHGASSLMSRKFARGAGPTALPHAGLARETLINRGRLIASVIGLSHDTDLDVLRESCPEAVPNAVVAGDICLDRMIASQPLRRQYRQALGIHGDEPLITVSSTWSTESAFGQQPDLCRQLVDRGQREGYRVALVLHPNVWAVHGQWQVRTWLASCLRAGLLVVPPEEGWRAVMVASDGVIGDYGSTTQYAAAIGRPVLLAEFAHQAVRQGSIADSVVRLAATIDLDLPVLPQFRQPVGQQNIIAGLITSRPGQSAAVLRAAMYRLLDLSEPDHPAVAPPVPLPQPLQPVLR